MEFLRKMRETDPNFKVKDDLEPPELTFLDQYYTKAFYALNGSHQIGMSLAPIPMSEIIMYGEYIGDDDMDAFIHIMQAVDGVYLSEYFKQQSKSGDSNGTS